MEEAPPSQGIVIEEPFPNAEFRVGGPQPEPNPIPDPQAKDQRSEKAVITDRSKRAQ